MAHTIFYNPEIQIIEAKITGDLFKAEADVIISEIVQTTVKSNCFLSLSDYREAVSHLSTIELFEVPKKVLKEFALFGIHPVKLKRAIVVASDLKDFHFFETTTLNSGQNVKLFQDIDEAKKWLLDK